MAQTIMLKHLRSASEADVQRALDGAYIELPICDAASALELFQRMLDVMVSPRGEDE